MLQREQDALGKALLCTDSDLGVITSPPGWALGVVLFVQIFSQSWLCLGCMGLWINPG